MQLNWFSDFFNLVKTNLFGEIVANFVLKPEETLVSTYAVWFIQKVLPISV